MRQPRTLRSIRSCAAACCTAPGHRGHGKGSIRGTDHEKTIKAEVSQALSGSTYEVGSGSLRRLVPHLSRNAAGRPSLSQIGAGISMSRHTHLEDPRNSRTIFTRFMLKLDTH